MNAINHRSAPNNAGELCDLTATNGVIVEMFRSAKYTGDREGLTGFRPSKVTKGDTTVWEFRTSGAKVELSQVAEIYEFGEDGKEELVIAICDKRTIFSVVRVNDFANSAIAILNGKKIPVGASSVSELLQIKVELAEGLQMGYDYDAVEAVILRKQTELRNQAQAAAKVLEKEKKAADQKKREDAIAAIKARKNVEGWDPVGKHYFGIPITGTEWQSLPDFTYCIEMKNDQPVVAFIVKKEGSRVKKIRETEITGQPPVKKEVTGPEAYDQMTVTLKGRTESILLFETMNAIKTLQQNGLNSGTWVGHISGDKQTVTVHEVTAAEIKTVGTLKRQAAETC